MLWLECKVYRRRAKSQRSEPANLRWRTNRWGLVTIIEVKSAIFTASNKYSGDHKLLAEEIDQKLVLIQKDKNKKAVLQLSDAVQQFLTDEALCRSIGIEIAEITAIYPLVVTFNSVGGTIGIYRPT